MNPIIYPASIIFGTTLYSVAKSRTVMVKWPADGVHARLKKATQVALNSLCVGVIADCVLSTRNLGILVHLADKTGSELTRSALKCSLCFGGLFLCSGLLTYRVTSSELCKVDGFTYPKIRLDTDLRAFTLNKARSALLDKSKTLQERFNIAMTTMKSENSLPFYLRSIFSIKVAQDDKPKLTYSITTLNCLKDALEVLADNGSLNEEIKYKPREYCSEVITEVCKVIENSIVELTPRDGCPVKYAKSYEPYQKVLSRFSSQVFNRGSTASS
jgi:hypothetical protein